MKRIVLFLKSREKKFALSNDYLIGEFLLALLLIVISILFPLFSNAEISKKFIYTNNQSVSRDCKSYKGLVNKKNESNIPFHSSKLTQNRI